MPKAVIIVDLYGQSADYEKLLPICEHYKVPVIEDSAEALGATNNGKKCGTFGHINIFSFNGNKIITTSGGGMAVSDNEEAIKKIRFWATQSREPVRHYEHREIGYNYRMSNISAGIGRGQLKCLNKKIIIKKKIRKRYEDGLKDLPIKFMPVFKMGRPNYWLTVITINKDNPVLPEDIIIALEKENIESRPVWKPMSMQPIFRNNILFNDNNFVSENVFKKGICLPSGEIIISWKIQDMIIKTIEKRFEK